MKGYLIEKQVDFDNSIIYYLQGGIASYSAPILFLHGWGVAVEPYQEILNLLSQRYQVIAPYLPGLGKSTAPEYIQDYSDYAELMLEFIKILKLPKVHIIGHSIGGAIGMALAALQPSIVRSLTIVDSTGIPLGSLPEFILRRVIEMPAQMGQMKFDTLTTMLQNLFCNSLFNLQTVIQEALLGIEKDIRPFLPRITSPCLVLWGKNDLLTPVTLAQEISQEIRGSKLVILDGVYHEWSLAFPEKFAAIASDFMDEIERKSAKSWLIG